jgi:hypothetical protein
LTAVAVADIEVWGDAEQPCRMLKKSSSFLEVLSIQVMGQRPYQELKARGSTFLDNVEQEGLAI